MAAATESQSGSGERWGPLWGARARDWAEIEDQQHPTYEEAIRRAGIGPGKRVLDVGCGTGMFLRVAADAGAQVHGLDASEELLKVARSRLPEADLRTGDMESLPFDDDSFDVVTGFNSFFFANDMVAALREAGRVAKPGAPVVIQVWGAPERCQLTAMREALKPFLPPPPPSPDYWSPGVLEEIATAAGLTPEDAFDVSWAFEFADEETLARRLLAPGVTTIAIDRAGESEVRQAIVTAMAPYRTDAGGYRVANEWHYLIARA
jgi:SAM-dependent methyltransferase